MLGIHVQVENLAHAFTCMEYMSWVKECSIHAIRGLVNHGPLIGWAIQQGHEINWSEVHQNYIPSLQGTPQEKPSTTIATTTTTTALLQRA